jgi:cyclopropane fatty-acyl-phospholipid synthase-like methyltransferase
MNPKIDLLYSTYENFETEVLARIRRKTFGEDFGQNSWTTAEEYRRWAEWLDLDERSHVLEVASGSGGPAVFLAQLSGARFTGIDINAHGVNAATHRAEAQGLSDRVSFRVVDGSAALSFSDRAFDAIVCIDAANHLADRWRVLKEWHRVLKPGGKLLFTDPVVVTGLVSNAELAVRSSIGYFLFAPAGVNEALITDAGFELEQVEDVTENAALVSQRWHAARAEDRAALVEIEGEERFDNLQAFFATVHRLTSEHRLSRIAYLARKHGSS